MTQQQQTGTIERLTDKGYGFIRTDAERTSVFFHARGLQQGLRFNEIEEGDQVCFTSITTDKGQTAIDVEIIGRPLASLPGGAADADNVYDWGESA